MWSLPGKNLEEEKEEQGVTKTASEGGPGLRRFQSLNFSPKIFLHVQGAPAPTATVVTEEGRQQEEMEDGGAKADRRQVEVRYSHCDVALLVMTSTLCCDLAYQHPHFEYEKDEEIKVKFPTPSK
jgi:hypothetical protein